LGRAEISKRKKRFPLLDHLSLNSILSLLFSPVLPLLCSVLLTFIAIFHVPAYDSQLGPVPFLVEEEMAKERV